MDIDAYVSAHSPTWRRLEHLLNRANRPRRCSGAELDELVDLYQRTATHLSVIRTSSPDPLLVDRLSSLTSRARGVVAGSRVRGWGEVRRFFVVTFPAAVYRARWWALAAAVFTIVVGAVVAIWVDGDPQVQRAIGSPEYLRQLVEHDFEDYYSSGPAASFASAVFVNNAWVAAQAFAFGILLCLPTVYVLLQNALNVGVAAGLMAAHDRLDVFFGLILPHGLLELTAIFIAAGVGLRIGWTVIDPGSRRRADAVAEEGRASVAVVLGLVCAFAVAGFIEGYVTPSGWPTWARVGFGVVVEAAFLTYVLVLGRRAVANGETGDLLAELRGDRELTS
ncbi:MAG TPA: stage II sporulation protein M [Frankiaceae bacterium]|nr:stage II sporulation protein M [Frankiaceae bacterium]